MIAVTALLEPEGVRSFCDSYYQLLGCIERKIAAGAGRQQTQHPRPRCPRQCPEYASSFGAFLEVKECG